MVEETEVIYAFPKPILHVLQKTFAHLDKHVFLLRLNEFLKFIYLFSKYRVGFIPVTVEVDEIWHAFILQTRSYDVFCSTLPGKCFIHHHTIPLEDYTAYQDKKTVIEKMVKWLPRYYHHFGELSLSQARLWTVPRFLLDVRKMRLEHINAFAKRALKDHPEVLQQEEERLSDAEAC